jgi:integrase
MGANLGAQRASIHRRMNVCACALSLRAISRCCHGLRYPLAWARRRADSETAEDQRHVGDPGASAVAGGARHHGERTLDVPGHHDRQAAYGDNAFGAQFRNWCDAAGLPKHCTAHGLRKAAYRRLAEAGCSGNEIMAISGHATLKELVRYTAAADQARLARNAMTKAIIR